jgi:predicted RNase H-like HicB family nuclease
MPDAAHAPAFWSSVAAAYAGGKIPKKHGLTRFPLILTPDEDGGFVVEYPVIPGCISQGDSRDEALAHIREAIELCLENQSAEGWLLPEPE